MSFRELETATPLSQMEKYSKSFVLAVKLKGEFNATPWDSPLFHLVICGAVC